MDKAIPRFQSNSVTGLGQNKREMDVSLYLSVMRILLTVVTAKQHTLIKLLDM
jgi:hypothetical protein